MVCIARGLGFEDDYFVKAHDITRPESQTVCRLLHYFESPRDSRTTGEVYHRAGAHADWDLLTLLFQKAGQSGLEICPGRELSTSFGYGDSWTKVEPDAEKNAISKATILFFRLYAVLSQLTRCKFVILAIFSCFGPMTDSNRRFIV